MKIIKNYRNLMIINFLFFSKLFDGIIKKFRMIKLKKIINHKIFIDYFFNK